MLSQPINIAVVGCGAWGLNLVRNFHKLDVLYAISDPSQNSLQKVASQYGVKAMLWDEVLQDKCIDALVIAAPTALHTKLVSEGLRCGKHIFVEKPLALNLEDADSLCRLAIQSNRKLMIGHLLQYHPVFLKLKSLVKSGVLGKIHHISSTRLNLGRIRRKEDVMWDCAPHDISMILELLQEEPTYVHASGGFYIDPTIADMATILLGFPEGQKAQISVSWLHPIKEQKLVVVGEKAMAIFDDCAPWEQKLSIVPFEVLWKDGVPIPTKDEKTYIEVEQKEPLFEECRHFIDAIMQNTTPFSNGDEALRVMRVLERATESMKISNEKTLEISTNCKKFTIVKNA